MMDGTVPTVIAIVVLLGVAAWSSHKLGFDRGRERGYQQARGEEDCDRPTISSRATGGEALR